MAKIILTAMLTMLSGAVSLAQNAGVKLTETISSDNSMHIIAEPSGYGSYTVWLTINETNNVKNSKSTPYEITKTINGKTEIASFTPSNTSKPAKAEYYLDWINGKVNAIPDLGFVYRLPIANDQNTSAKSITPAQADMGRNNTSNFRIWQFYAEPGDPVFAVRKGIVISAQDGGRPESPAPAAPQKPASAAPQIPATSSKSGASQNSPTSSTSAVTQKPASSTIIPNSGDDQWANASVVIEHADGTQAIYTGLKGGTLAVAPGDTVLPSQRIGSAGKFFDGSKGVRVGIYSFIPNRNKGAYPNLKVQTDFINPLYSTSTGNTILEDGMSVTSKVSLKILKAETGGQSLWQRMLGIIQHTN